MMEWRNAQQLQLLFTCSKVCCLMWGISPSFWCRGVFLVHNLYIYLTCFCVRWPPAFFKGRVLRDFLSCSLALFWSRKPLPFHKQEQRPYSCHLAWAGACTWTGTRCRSSRVNMHLHGGGGGRPTPPAAGPGQICAIAWVLFHTNTDTAESVMCLRERWGVESSSHTHASRRNLPPLLPVENTRRARGEEIKIQNEIKWRGHFLDKVLLLNSSVASGTKHNKSNN